MRLIFALAEETDATELADLRGTTARDLTVRYGRGHWSGETTERSVLSSMRRSQLWVARRGRAIVATFRLSTAKPWAIDRSYFAKSNLPIYLTDMAVRPGLQGQGIGRRCLVKAIEYARASSADAIRLDAYDDEAGAGEFYTKCGFHEVGRVGYRGVPLVYYELLIREPLKSGIPS